MDRGGVRSDRFPRASNGFPSRIWALFDSPMGEPKSKGGSSIELKAGWRVARGLEAALGGWRVARRLMMTWRALLKRLDAEQSLCKEQETALIRTHAP